MTLYLPLERHARTHRHPVLAAPHPNLTPREEELIERRDGYTPRYELVDGALLVTPAPSHRHQRIAFALALRLHAYVLEHRLGEVCLGPGAVRLDTVTYFE